MRPVATHSTGRGVGGSGAPLFVVAEGGAVGGLRVAAERARLRGLAVTDGFAAARPGTACRGAVSDESSAQQALLAALAGADLLVAADADAATVDRLCDDLRRIGRVEHLTGDDATDGSQLDRLDDDVIALLALLARGLSLGAAATRLHLSRRTADRRLAQARAALGAHGTAEVVARLRGDEPNSG
jgi:DNA-binding NarL/FixJ family response regulator